MLFNGADMEAIELAVQSIDIRMRFVVESMLMKSTNMDEVLCLSTCKSIYCYSLVFEVFGRHDPFRSREQISIWTVSPSD